MEHGQEVLDRLNGEDKDDNNMSKAQKGTLETASVISNETHQPTVVSSATCANLPTKLETLATKLE